MNISLKLDKNQPNSENLFPLYVRIRGKKPNGKTTESSISSGLYLKSNHITDGSLKTGIKNYSDKQRVVNSLISDIEHVISLMKSDGLEPTPQVVKKRYEDLKKTKTLNSPQLISFWGGFQEFLDSKKHLSRGYVKTFITLRNRLKGFEKKEGILLTYDFIVGNTEIFQTKFQNYLWEKREVSNSYVNKLLHNLSQILYYSQQRGYIKKKPSFNKNDNVDRLEKVYLYTSEVLKLFKSSKWNYSNTNDFDNPHIYIIEQELKGTRSKYFGGTLKVTNWELVKDIFLFQCSIGCRYSDIPYFKVTHFDFDSDTQTFSWIQQKTNKRVSVPVNVVSGEIFRKYSSGKSPTQILFPKLSIQKFNKTLKLLLKDLGFNRLVTHPKKIGSKLVDTDQKFLWELISSHGGRRSFIKNMIDVGTMDYKTIMSMSGHRSMSEFEKYVSVTKNDLKKGMKLYHIDDPNTDLKVDELVKEFVNLDDDNRELILNMIRKLKN